MELKPQIFPITQDKVNVVFTVDLRELSNFLNSAEPRSNRGRPRLLTDAQQLELIEDYSVNGLSVDELSQKYNLGKTTVWLYLRRVRGCKK